MSWTRSPLPWPGMPAWRLCALRGAFRPAQCLGTRCTPQLPLWLQLAAQPRCPPAMRPSSRCWPSCRRRPSPTQRPSACPPWGQPCPPLPTPCPPWLPAAMTQRRPPAPCGAAAGRALLLPAWQPAWRAQPGCRTSPSLTLAPQQWASQTPQPCPQRS